MTHYLTDVRQSMLSSRRTQPIPQDFLQALHTHQLSLRSLVPHLKPPVLSKKSQYTLQNDGPGDDDWPKDLNILGPLLSSGPDQKMKSFIPKHFPVLPSMHTYQATAEFVDREQDPRKIREQATEEGRLGEDALRKLVAKASAHPTTESLEPTKRLSAKEKRKRIWLETMEAVERDNTGSLPSGADSSSIDKGKLNEAEPFNLALRGIVGSAVNAEKKYWRKPAS